MSIMFPLHFPPPICLFSCYLCLLLLPFLIHHNCSVSYHPLCIWWTMNNWTNPWNYYPDTNHLHSQLGPPCWRRALFCDIWPPGRILVHRINSFPWIGLDACLNRNQLDRCIDIRELNRLTKIMCPRATIASTGSDFSIASPRNGEEHCTFFLLAMK